MSKANGLVKNTFIISIGKISTQIISFLLLPLYTAKISTEDYGNADFIISIAAFVVPFLTLLLEESMFRFLIDARDDGDKEKIISHTFIICAVNTMLISIIFGIIMCISQYNLGFSIWMYCIASVFIALSNALARGKGEILTYSVSNFIASVMTIALNLVFILGLHWGFRALILSGVIANTVAALFVYFRSDILRYLKFSNIDLGLVKKMLKYSIPLVPNTISWGIINVSDRLVLMGILGASINGLYSVAYKFPNLINTFYSFFVIAWKETSAKMAKDNDFSEMKKITEAVNLMLFSVTILMITGIRFVYPLFVNKNYWDGVMVVPLLSISVFYSSLAGYIGGIFTAFKDTKILGTTSFVAAIINLLIDLCLVRHFGIFAAAISTLIASVFLYFYRGLQVRKYTHFLSIKDIVYILCFICLTCIFYVNKSSVNIIIFVVSIVISVLLNYRMGCKMFIKTKNKFLKNRR
ncbi:oligosaccharide flippase family protein [Hungatella sp. L12]|uniref:Oligosaccharide flippase family protein n=1 Tax=Hungatella hominis TaxID=2763050 RepID=A0ABR7HBL7_9FIRM|nr:oligosaccharide flippase family protein [Hungatella hominis]MBC5710562.1 oligosaccharide flippase family protein [Hungatella hominis]